jgi:thymidylate synthase (FAD)
MGSDESVVEAARTSTDAGFRGWNTDIKLLDYLYESGHSGPFEMCELVVEYQAPIFCERQMVRHRTMSRNELSARYTELPDLFYVPTQERCLDVQDKINKQGSTTMRTLEDLSLEETRALDRLEFAREQVGARQNYQARLDNNMARELARINLPLSQYTRVRVKGNLRNWFHFLGLRLDEHAQWETRQFAERIYELIQTIWPRSTSLFEEYDLFGARLSRTELQLLRKMLAYDECSVRNLHVNALNSFGESSKKIARFFAKLGVKVPPVLAE